MARKQAEIPGFERQIENPVIEAAAEAFVEANVTWKNAAKQRTKMQLNLLATLRSEKVEKYEFIDENGEVLVAKIVIGDEKAVVEKVGEADSELGNTLGVDAGDDLVAQAAAAQGKVNVEENDDGDVVVPETSVPKKKRGRKPAAAAPGVH